MGQFCVSVVSPKVDCVHLVSKGGGNKYQSYWKSLLNRTLNGFMTHWRNCAACTRGGQPDVEQLFVSEKTRMRAVSE